MKAQKTVISGITFDSALEASCYQAVIRAVNEFALAYNVLAHVPLKLKPRTAVYPAMNYKVDIVLDPKSGYQTKLKPILIEVKSQYYLERSDFILKMKFLECWNKQDYNNLILVGNKKLTTPLTIPTITIADFPVYLWRNHKLV